MIIFYFFLGSDPLLYHRDGVFKIFCCPGYMSTFITCTFFFFFLYLLPWFLVFTSVSAAISSFLGFPGRRYGNPKLLCTYTVAICLTPYGTGDVFADGKESEDFQPQNSFFNYLIILLI